MNRSIPITTDDLQLLPAVKRLTFAKSTLPINRIHIAAELGQTQVIVINFTVRDTNTGELKELAWPLAVRVLAVAAQYKSRSLGNIVRRALVEVMTHEIDECLMLDGEHLNEPHP